jgi:leucyl aminopeptidase (aminopeptidase T)
MKIVDQMAKTLVNESLRIKKTDVVIVSTYQHTIDMANALAMECFKKGADVLMTLDTDDVFYGHLKVLPKSNLKVTSAHCLGLSEYTDVNIFIGGPEDPGPMKNIPSEKFSALFEGEAGHFEKSRKKGVRFAYLPLGMVTPQRAKTYGFPYNAWMRNVTDSMRASPKKMSAFGKKLANRLSKAKKVHITSKQGTDLTFRLGKREVFIHDGILSEADVKKGNTFVTLPSGEVGVAPLEGSAEGTIVFDVPQPSTGKLVKNLKWTFKKGKLTKFQASSNVRALKDFYDNGHGDKDRIGWFGMGINPKAKVGYLMSAIANGAVTVGIGGNVAVGGKNKSDYETAGTMSKATVELDGKVIIKNGKFTL